MQTFITLIICLISSLQEPQCWLSLDVRCQNQDTRNKRGREGSQLRVGNDCLHQMPGETEENPKFKSQKQGWRQATAPGAQSGAGTIGSGGEQASRKGGPVQAIAMKAFAALGTRLGHVAGDVLHGLIWFKGPKVEHLFRFSQTELLFSYTLIIAQNEMRSILPSVEWFWRMQDDW